MRPSSRLLVVAPCLSLAAVAALVPPARAGAPPVCNAKHKRPANLYGSILSEGLKPTVGEVPPPGAPPKPGVAASTPGAPNGATAKPVGVSRAELKASFGRCGAGGRA